MKKNLALLFLLSTSLCVSAQNVKTQKTIFYSGTRLTYPLIEAWAKEYSKTHPDVSLQLIPRGDTSKVADLKVLAYNLEKEDLGKDKFTVVAQYAQLPITNQKNPQLKEWQQKGLTEEDLKKLYFKSLGEENNETPKHNTVTIYTRQKAACATKAFASHFNADVKQSKGVGVPGDDKTLLQAVIDDTSGVSYNNLGFVYNINTRKVIPGIAVIPVDINGNRKIDSNENFYSNLDELIRKLEDERPEQITVDKVNFVYNENASHVKDFLQWVLKDGQKVNHQYGFLENNKNIEGITVKK